MITIRKISKFMHIFKWENMFVPCQYVTMHIDQITYSKDLILDAISQNDAIKGGNWKICKKHSWVLEVDFDKQKSFALVAFLHCIGTPLQLAQFEYSKLNLSRHPKKILSYYNTRPLKSKLVLKQTLCLIFH